MNYLYSQQKSRDINCEISTCSQILNDFLASSFVHLFCFFSEYQTRHRRKTMYILLENNHQLISN